MGGEGDDGAFAVTNTENNGYVIAGYSDSQGSNISNALVANVDQAASQSSFIPSFELMLLIAFSVLTVLLISVLVYKRKNKK